MSSPPPWFRLYAELLDDPKVQNLPAPLFKAYINVLCIASKATPRGVLPPVADVGFALRVSPSEAAKTLDRLKVAGLLDERAEGGLTPHGWHARQFQSDDSTARVKRFRERSRAVSADVRGDVSNPLPETPPEQSRAETETYNPPSPPRKAAGAYMREGRQTRPSGERSGDAAPFKPTACPYPEVVAPAGWNPNGNGGKKDDSKEPRP